MVELTESNYSWPFVFKLPTNCPFSYCDDHVEVSYSLTAVLDAPIVPLSVATLQHTLVVGALPGAALELVRAPESVLGYAHMQAPLSARAAEAGGQPRRRHCCGGGGGRAALPPEPLVAQLFPDHAATARDAAAAAPGHLHLHGLDM